MKWPSLAEVKKTRKQTIMNFFNQHNSRYPKVNEKRFSDIKNTIELTDDHGVIKPNKILIEVLMPQLKLFLEGIDRMDIEIKVSALTTAP